MKLTYIDRAARETPPLKTNPGGQIPPAEVIGRDALIQRLWRVLERQSLVLSAERRMGKTCLIRKMVAEAPPSRLPLYRDLEGLRTPLEFVDTILNDVESHLSGIKRTANRVHSLVRQLAGTEMKGLKLPDSVAPHWKALLTTTLEDLVEHQLGTVVLFWDEMPLMLHNLKRSSGEAAAMEVLDALRSLRQMQPRLRMVFAGSIGLHNVVTSLRRAGYANDPTNDMDTVDVPPLSTGHAQELARGLLRGERIHALDLSATAAAIAAAVDGVPYFIHHVIDQIAQRGHAADVAAVSEIVSQSLTDPQDRWHLRYYRERIDTYYSPDECPCALILLDILSSADQPLPFDTIFNLLKSQIVTEDVEMARDVLTLLQRDHYLVQQPDGKYRFCFPLIQRSWRLQRGLAP
jgi:hypothetical protein